MKAAEADFDGILVSLVMVGGKWNDQVAAEPPFFRSQVVLALKKELEKAEEAQAQVEQTPVYEETPVIEAPVEYGTAEPQFTQAPMVDASAANWEAGAQTAPGADWQQQQAPAASGW